MHIKQVNTMAIIIKSRYPENVGRIVKVLQFIGTVPHSRLEDAWLVKPDRPLTGALHNMKTGEFFGITECEVAHVNDENLRPLTGLDDDCDSEELYRPSDMEELV